MNQHSYSTVNTMASPNRYGRFLVLVLLLSNVRADMLLRRVQTIQNDHFDDPSYQNNAVLKGYSTFLKIVVDRVPGAPQGLIELPAPQDEDSQPLEPQATKKPQETFMDIFNGPIPAMSMATSDAPSESPTEVPTFLIVTKDTPAPEPTWQPTRAPTNAPDISPTPIPTPAPTRSPSQTPTRAPTPPPTNTPTNQPSNAPSTDPTGVPSQDPTNAPTLVNCGISRQSRQEQILALLDSVSNPALIRDPQDPRGQATEWLLNADDRVVCPDDEKILQRWVLAVIYYSTGGDNWDKCMAKPDPINPDQCGTEDPFVSGEDRFLSPGNECRWAGITCSNSCVSEIEFEDNNLVGTIPEEIGLLTDLEVLGMERGGLASTIPTSLGLLTKLSFIDLDFNMLTGSLSSELLSLSALTVLDLNDNQLTGNIHGMVGYPDMIWLQIHRNRFTGTIPSNIGTFSNMSAFTLHATNLQGTMPVEICNLLAPNVNNWPTAAGSLTSLIADCKPGGNVECPCCTICR